MKGPTTKGPRRTQTCWTPGCGATSWSNRGGVLRRRPCWRLGNAQISLWNGSHVGTTLDQAWKCRAKNHSTAQWRVCILRGAQVSISCFRNQSNVGRLALRSLRDSRALRQQRGERHVCSARVRGNSTRCRTNKQYREDV